MSIQAIKYLQFLLQKQNYQYAEEESIKFLVTQKIDQEILNILGLARLGLKKNDLAIESFNKAITIENKLIFQFNLGFAYLAKGLKLCAYKIFINLFRKNFFSYAIYKHLYSLCKKKVNKEKIFDKIISSFPNNTQELINQNTYNFLVQFLKMEEFDFVITFCTKTLQIKKNSIILNILANAYFLNDDMFNAEINYKKSLQLDSTNYSIFFDIAEFYKSKGDMSKALDNYQKAIALNRNIDGELHRCFSYARKYVNDKDEHFNFLKKTLENFNDNQVNGSTHKMHLLFGLAKAYEDICNYEESYKNFSQANRIAQKINPHDDTNVKNEFKIYQKFFSNFNFLKYEKFGVQTKDVRPIFIVGLPRSGSTLLEQIISSHRLISSKGESKIFGKNLSHLFNTYDFEKFEKDLVKIYNDPTIITKLGQLYVDKSLQKKTKKIFTDKMLFNFLYLGLIRIGLPNSKIIVCQRDYRDIFVSMIKNYFSESKMSFAFSETHLLNYIQFYHKVLNFWKSKLNSFVHIIKYDELILDQTQMTKKILEICEMEWDDNCLNFNKNENIVKTLSSTQVRSGIYKNSLNTWKVYEEQYADIFQQLVLLQKNNIS